jgi:hypothetical protein
MQNNITISGKKNGMKLSFKPYDLQLKHPFSIIGGKISLNEEPGIGLPGKRKCKKKLKVVIHHTKKYL